MLITNPPAAITPQLWMLGTDDYPLFLYKGQRHGTIFEGGVGAMGPLVVEQLRGMGLGPGFVTQVVIPHAHPDHVMAVPGLREAFPGVAVVASEAAAGTLATAKAIAFFRQLDDAITGSLARAGRITEAHRPAPLAQDRIAVDRLVREGDTVEVDEGVAFRVLETPGHSDCSLSFHEPGAGVLVISDATGYYVPDPDFWWPNYFTGYEAYVNSIRRLAALGAEVLCLGHNAAIVGAPAVRAHFDEVLAATRRYHERIIGEAEAGRSVREIAGQLGSEVYARMQLLPLEFFQKNCGLLVKQSLRYAGLEPDAQGNVQKGGV
ncbi:MAG: MBL fold metallo-hydrolase [Planctomycetes bacterium]|nr:MBL fold metallo-hydrolase [Planctomycetota bacterium]